MDQSLHVKPNLSDQRASSRQTTAPVFVVEFTVGATDGAGDVGCAAAEGAADGDADGAGHMPHVAGQIAETARSEQNSITLLHRTPSATPLHCGVVLGAAVSSSPMGAEVGR